MKATADYTVIHADESFVALNKRAGLLVAGDRYDDSAPRLDKIASAEFGRLLAVHRIDRDTSGVILYARTEDARRSLCAQLEKRTARKTYHCLARGKPAWESVTVDLPLLVDGDDRHRTVVSKKYGKPSSTVFTLIGSCGPFSWIEARPVGGRTHQIRAHIASLGLPILCDELYGHDNRPFFLSSVKRRWNGDEFEERALLARLALHAYKIEIDHPATKERMALAAPYPRDMDAARKQLKKIYGVDPIEEKN